MGLIPDVWKESRIEDQLVLKKPEQSMDVVKTPLPEPKKAMKKIKRVTIEWEDKARSDSVYDIDGKTVNSNSGNYHYFIYFYDNYFNDKNGKPNKCILFPNNNLHSITEEDIEVPVE